MSILVLSQVWELSQATGGQLLVLLAIAEEKAMNEPLERLVPCLDVMAAIMKRTGPGPRGVRRR